MTRPSSKGGDEPHPFYGSTNADAHWKGTMTSMALSSDGSTTPVDEMRGDSRRELHLVDGQLKHLRTGMERE
jgi:hypothetical protein